MSSRGNRSRARRARSRARRWWVAASVSIAAALVAVAGLSVFAAARGETPYAASPAPSAPRSAPPTASPTPLSEAEALLATASDPAACAVSFAGEGITIAPMLQSEGSLYAGLPIPRADGRVFAGWYAQKADAAALAVSGRINGADPVACTARQATLHGAWTTPAANTAEDARIPILMYHQFTTKPEGESGWLRLNYAYIADFDAHMAHISQSGFYLPTWDELSAFIDGALFLPQHSVIVTDDDADSTWLELAAPVVEKHQVLTTSFVITKWRSEQTPNRFVLQRSHTHDMHEAGANGKGRMVNWSAAEIAADLEHSAATLGTKEVVAYPFGHFSDEAKRGVAAAGFEMARTIENGHVAIGTDKLALPTIRIDYGMTVDDLAARIG